MARKSNRWTYITVRRAVRPSVSWSYTKRTIQNREKRPKHSISIARPKERQFINSKLCRDTCTVQRQTTIMRANYCFLTKACLKWDWLSAIHVFWRYGNLDSLYSVASDLKYRNKTQYRSLMNCPSARVHSQQHLGINSNRSHCQDASTCQIWQELSWPTVSKCLTECWPHVSKCLSFAMSCLSLGKSDTCCSTRFQMSSKKQSELQVSWVESFVLHIYDLLLWSSWVVAPAFLHKHQPYMI